MVHFGQIQKKFKKEKMDQ